MYSIYMKNKNPSLSALSKNGNVKFSKRAKMRKRELKLTLSFLSAFSINRMRLNRKAWSRQGQWITKLGLYTLE